MTLVDVNLIPLNEERNRILDEAKEADWSGNTPKANYLYDQVRHIDDRIKNGEVYEVLF